MDVELDSQTVVQEKSNEKENCSDASEFPKIYDDDAESILDSVSPEYIANFQPVRKRYFEEKYCTTFSNEKLNLDTCIRVHSNKICVVYISDRHALFKNKEKIKRLNFQVGPKTNRLNNTFSGKGKRGAQFLVPNSVLCRVEMENGDSYPIHAGIHGKLLEINSEIVDRSQLIVEDNVSNGFIAVLLSDLRKFKDDLSNMKTHSEYYDLHDEEASKKCEK